MIWKALYDFSRWNWHAYGHVLFVDSESQEDAEALARAGITAVIPADATITRVTLSSATEAQRQRHQRRVEAAVIWMRNVSSGQPNEKTAL